MLRRKGEAEHICFAKAVVALGVEFVRIGSLRKQGLRQNFLIGKRDSERGFKHARFVLPLTV